MATMDSAPAPFMASDVPYLAKLTHFIQSAPPSLLGFGIRVLNPRLQGMPVAWPADAVTGPKPVFLAPHAKIKKMVTCFMNEESIPKAADICEPVGDLPVTVLPDPALLLRPCMSFQKGLNTEDMLPQEQLAFDGLQAVLSVFHTLEALIHKDVTSVEKLVAYFPSIVSLAKRLLQPLVIRGKDEEQYAITLRPFLSNGSSMGKSTFTLIYRLAQVAPNRKNRLDFFGTVDRAEMKNDWVGKVHRLNGIPYVRIDMQRLAGMERAGMERLPFELLPEEVKYLREAQDMFKDQANEARLAGEENGEPAEFGLPRRHGGGDRDEEEDVEPSEEDESMGGGGGGGGGGRGRGVGVGGGGGDKRRKVSPSDE